MNVIADAKPLVLDQVEFDGKTYDVPLPLREHFAALGHWLEEQALRRIEAMQGHVAPEIFERRYEGMLRLVGSGAFEPGQPEYVRAAGGMEAVRHMLLILLRSRHPDFPEAALADVFAPFWANVQKAAARAAVAARAAQVPQPS